MRLKVLDALEGDYEFPLQGDVFTNDLIETWIRYKRERELAPVNVRPVPYEFFLYYFVIAHDRRTGAAPATARRVTFCLYLCLAGE